MVYAERPQGIRQVREAAVGVDRLAPAAGWDRNQSYSAHTAELFALRRGPLADPVAPFSRSPRVPRRPYSLPRRRLPRRSTWALQIRFGHSPGPALSCAPGPARLPVPLISSPFEVKRICPETAGTLRRPH